MNGTIKLIEKQFILSEIRQRWYEKNSDHYDLVKNKFEPFTFISQ